VPPPVSDSIEPARITVTAPAKINLHLGVGAPREDGFHPLTSVYQAVGVYDDLTVTEAHFAGIGAHEAGHDSQQRGLATAGRPEDGHQGAVGDRQVDTPQDRVAGIGLGESCDGHCAHRGTTCGRASGISMKSSPSRGVSLRDSSIVAGSDARTSSSA
jgi:hypothetical protein